MGSWCQKSLLKSLFYFNFLSSICKKKLQNHTSLSSLPYQGFSGLIRFSSVREAPHFCTNCKHCGRLIHDRKMHNILRARFRFTDSPSNAARNARTQSQIQTHSMAAVNCTRRRPLTIAKCIAWHVHSGEPNMPNRERWGCATTKTN